MVVVIRVISDKTTMKHFVKFPYYIPDLSFVLRISTIMQHTALVVA